MIKCICSSKLYKNCDECSSNPNMINKLSVDDQKILFMWILTNLRPVSNINYDAPNSMELITEFKKYKHGFSIENGTLKGAMHKLGYKHTYSLNWNFNIPDKKIKNVKGDIHMSKIIPSSEWAKELSIFFD